VGREITALIIREPYDGRAARDWDAVPVPLDAGLCLFHLSIYYTACWGPAGRALGVPPRSSQLVEKCPYAARRIQQFPTSCCYVSGPGAAPRHRALTADARVRRVLSHLAPCAATDRP
jgi:hypothetical protein